jgi:Tol biopolymer transport system component
MSADGRYIVFASSATNLVATDTNNVTDIYLRDMQTGLTTLVSQDASGSGEGNGSSTVPQISADGQRVLFLSMATNLTTNGVADGGIAVLNAFWRDLQAGVTYAITTQGSVAFAAMTPNGSNVLVTLTESENGQLILWNAQTHSATTLSPAIFDYGVYMT